MGPKWQPLGAMAGEISVNEYTLLEYNSFLAKGKIKLIALALEILENKGS